MKTYHQLMSESNGPIDYPLQLETEEWHNLRKLIIKRDKNSCQICGETCVELYLPMFVNKGKLVEVPAMLAEIETTKTYKFPYDSNVITIQTTELQLVPDPSPHYPHVHHKYYIQGHLAWEYPESALILLCHTCHLNLHKNNPILIYSNDQFIESQTLVPCSRCNGAGHFPEFEHVENGVCFKCRGGRFEW